MVAAAGTTYALAALFHDPQGYWAVFTAVIVVQGSVGGALTVSRDRLIGTLAGAVVGGVAAYLAPRTVWGEGVALAFAVGLLAAAAAKNASLKIGPVTAAILILTAGRHADSLATAALRVAEILLGSVVAIAATLVVFPARARDAARGRAATVLGQLDALLQRYGEALVARRTPVDGADLHAALRAGLTALEGAAQEAAQEERAHLSSRHFPQALPRTLWRLRNDAVVIGRSLSRSFPPAVADHLAAPAAALIEAARQSLSACAEALAAGVRTTPSRALADASTAFHSAFQGLRETGLMRGLEFDEVGHVFGLAWALEGLARNLADLADRIDELTPEPPKTQA